MTKAFERVLEETPLWIWILWIPQLLTAIIKNRNESSIAFHLLKKLTLFYPQATYYALKKIKSSPQLSHGGFEANPSVYLNDIFEGVKEKEPVLFEALENISEFICTMTVRPNL